MRAFPGWLVLAAAMAMAVVAGGFPARAADAPMAEIVVSMRYYQQTGKSHAHLYLYREDGKLLRQLTDDNRSQDRDPVFSPDGESIVFTRVNDAGGTDYWSVEPRGGNLRMLPAAPTWYTETKNAPLFSPLEDDPDTDKLIASDIGEGGSGKPKAPAGEPPTFRAPDGSVELVLKVSPENEGDSSNGEGHGKSYVLRDLKTGKSTAMGSLPGFFGLFNLMALDKNPDQRFLLVPPLRVAFFALHLDSTEGNTTFALDLEGRRLVRLSPNWGAPFLLPGEPAFLTWTENRYVPYGDGKRTENSSYVERWDAKLKAVRYAKGKAAGACAGASMYRPGRSPAVVSIRPEGE